MLRVTGGVLGGRLISASSAAKLRPTQQKVREALFSILADMIPGCIFLDLFAGSGAVGFEALSRGAAEVTMVESNRRRYESICRAAGSLVPPDAMLPRPAIVHEDVTRFLRRAALGKKISASNIVYADPPYARNADQAWEKRLAVLLEEARLPAPGGVWIMESRKSRERSLLPHWIVTDERVYGDTLLTFYKN